jgi:hypothetical protein
MDRPLIVEILARALACGFKLAPRCTLDGYPIIYRSEERVGYEVLKEVYVITEESKNWFTEPGCQPSNGLPAGFQPSCLLTDMLDYYASRNAK